MILIIISLCSLIMSCLIIQVVKAVGVCVEGLVHLFKCSLTNQIVAPISAHSSIQFVSTATKVRLHTLIHTIIINYLVI